MLFLLLACAPGVIQGEVDGDKVPALNSGFWYSEGSGEREHLVVVAASEPDSCEIFSALYSAFAEAYQDFATSFDVGALIDDLTDAETENVPEEYWVSTATLQVDPDDEEDVIDSYDLDDNDATYTIYHKTDYTEWDEILTSPSADHTDYFNAEDGELEVTGFSEDGAVSIKGTAELVDEDGDSEGEIGVRFYVRYCEEAEDAVEEYNEFQ
jgi:hypothetical protein